MSRNDSYEFERTVTRDDAAAVLQAVTDGVLAGSVRLGEGEDAVAVDVPDEVSLEVELEREDDELSMEVEMEWPAPGDGSAVEDAAGETDPDRAAEDDPPVPGEEAADDEDRPAPVGATDGTESLARFELFRDRAEEWRWRLRHRNGNVVATSGEGYTRKHNARKGLRSVVKNAAGADVIEGSGK